LEATTVRPIVDRSFAQGIGRTAEDCRRRRANLGVDRRCLEELSVPGRIGVDLFGRTREQLEKSVAFQERALKIAESY
jgi:hypothetical protein